MLLTGTFHRALDEKQRVAIPKRLRESLPEAAVLYVAPGTDGSLALYTEDSFEALGSDVGRASPNGQDVRAFSRLFYAQAQRVEVDRQGRVRIPAELAELAGLSREIVLLGVRDHLEIWERVRWEEYLGHKQPQYDQLAESACSAAPPSKSSPAAHTSDPDTRPPQPR